MAVARGGPGAVRRSGGCVRPIVRRRDGGEASALPARVGGDGDRGCRRERRVHLRPSGAASESDESREAQGADSLVLAVLAYEIREPTGLNSIIGGAPSLRRERAIFYLCVASQEQPSPVRRLAVFAKPRHMRTAFRSWVHSWGDPEIVIGSISGYDASTSDPAAARREWLRLHVSGRVERTAEWQGVQGAGDSLPPSCEAAAIADALESVSAAVLPD